MNVNKTTVALRKYSIALLFFEISNFLSFMGRVLCNYHSNLEDYVITY